jgi:hypothetical protein
MAIGKCRLVRESHRDRRTPMFRRLFALETEALQRHAEDLKSRLDQGEHQVGDALHEMMPVAHPSSRMSMWAMRSPI